MRPTKTDPKSQLKNLRWETFFFNTHSFRLFRLSSIMTSASTSASKSASTAVSACALSWLLMPLLSSWSSLSLINTSSSHVSLSSASWIVSLLSLSWSSSPVLTLASPDPRPIVDSNSFLSTSNLNILDVSDQN